MIKLTRLNHEVFYLNCDVIEYVEEVPHTVIKTVNSNTYVVVESVATIIQEVIEFKNKTKLRAPVLKENAN